MNNCTSKTSFQLKLHISYFSWSKCEIFVKERSLEFPDKSSSQRQPLSAVGTLYSALSIWLSRSLAVIHFIGVLREGRDNKSDKTDRKFDKKHSADKMNKKQAKKEAEEAEDADEDADEGNKKTAKGGRSRWRRHI